MRFQVRRGRNQRGFTFMKALPDELSNKIIRVSLGGLEVFTELKENENIPDGFLILDYRLYDGLICEVTSLVEIEPVYEEIPICSEIHLSVSSERDIDILKVTEAISKRVEDFDEHFDGLVVSINQLLHIEPLKLLFMVQKLEPQSAEFKISRIKWKHILKIKLNPKTHSDIQCYNLCSCMDIGAASQISDIASRASNDLAIGTTVMRNEVSFSIISTLMDLLSKCESSPIFSSVAFSSYYDIFTTLDNHGTPIDFTTIQTPGIISTHQKWLREKLVEHANNPSNPGLGLSTALELAKQIAEKNNLPTVLLLFSSGAYSLGKNPVKMVQSQFSDSENILLLCIGLGEDRDVTLIDAIARAGRGITHKVEAIRETIDIPSRIINLLGGLKDD